MSNNKTTKDGEYAERLANLSNVWWKKALNTQWPYRWNLRRLALRRVLDVGCGIGRNLVNLGDNSVGVDHNEHAIRYLKKQGFEAYTVDEFKRLNTAKKSFDSMLLAHVLEHLTVLESKELISFYLPYIKDKVVVICPQEKGYKTDETHVTFLDAHDIKNILENLGLKIEKSYSFPFPRFLGKVFPYNETVVIARK